MSGTVSNGTDVVGHTGGGPGSVVAVYYLPQKQPPITAAAYALTHDQSVVEAACFDQEF
jgi:hypothetical protein